MIWAELCERIHSSVTVPDLNTPLPRATHPLDLRRYRHGRFGTCIERAFWNLTVSKSCKEKNIINRKKKIKIKKIMDSLHKKYDLETGFH